MVRNYPNWQRCSNTTSFCFIGTVGTKQLAIFYICFRYQMKTRNPNKIQKRRLYTSKYYPDYPDYTHPHMLHTSKSPTFSIFYAATLFSSTKISFLGGFNSSSSDKNSNKKCKWIKSLKFFYKTLYFWLNPHYLLNI